MDLTHIPMEALDTECKLIESQGQPLRTESSLGKDYSLSISILIEQIDQIAVLHLRRNEDIKLL